jgi:hypothetical protein
VFTARYALSPYIKETRFAFKKLICREECKLRCCTLRSFLPFRVTPRYFKFIVSHQLLILKNPQCPAIL